MRVWKVGTVGTCACRGVEIVEIRACEMSRLSSVYAHLCAWNYGTYGCVRSKVRVEVGDLGVLPLKSEQNSAKMSKIAQRSIILDVLKICAAQSELLC